MRALGLLSGGLDSLLAARLLAGLGVAIECVRFDTGFGREDYLAAGAGQESEIVDIAKEYFERVVLKPRHGCGASMNPCVDCRIFMLRRADEMAQSRGIELLFTGEVIGQRAMAQSRSALLKIEREAGVLGRLLRPLSALLLPETDCERRGEVDRSKLGKLHGRSRRAQYDMAAGMGIERFPTPSGGCCWLARPDFGRRLRDCLAHRRGAALGADEIDLLKRGRHFRVAWNLKVIFGRNQEESEWLAARAGDLWSCQVADGRGSFGLLEGGGDSSGQEQAAALAARYSSHRTSGTVRVLLRRGGESRIVEAAPAAAESVEQWRV